MSGEVEAIGGLATGGLIAGAIDPSTGMHGEASARCANCETAIVGNYCHACGQTAHVHRTMGHVVEEFLHGILHLDTKAWRTLPLLLFRPGKLTRDYIYGRRARYIAPLALFLFTIFLMFFVFGLSGGPGLGDALFEQDSSAEEIADARAELDDALSEVRDAEAELAAAQADPDAGPGEIRARTGDLAGARTGLRVAQAALKRAEAQPQETKRAPVPAVTGEKPNWAEQMRADTLSGEIKVNTGNAEWDKRIRKALLNPELTLYKVEQKAYKLSFLLVPLSLPFLWMLFFWKRGVTLYDHTVFVLYSLSFMSLLFVAIALMMRGGDALVATAGLLFAFVPPVHIYAQLKGTYRLGWFGALWRTVVLLAAAQIVISLFLTLIIMLGMVD